MASSKLLQQLLEEVGRSVQESRSPRAQMLLNLKLSQARVISHLANIEAKTLGNLVLARRDSFLARSKVAGDQQLKNFLRTTSMSHTSLFAGQLTQLLRNCRSVRDASRFLLIEDPQPPLLQLRNRFNPPEVGPRRLSPMVHPSSSHPPPLLRLRLGSVEVARPRRTC